MKTVYVVSSRTFGGLDVVEQCSWFTQKPRLSMLLRMRKVVIIIYGVLLGAKLLAICYTFSQKLQTTLPNYYYYFHCTVEQVES